MSDADRMPAAIWADLWQRLSAGQSTAAHPFRTAALVTADALGRPDARTVVLRQLDPVARTLDFQTDRRSPKFSAIARNSGVAWLFYDAKDQLQLRLQAAAVAHTHDDVADAQWAAIPAAGRRGYHLPLAPGSTLATPDVPTPDPNEGDGDGRSHFAVIRCTLTSVEWLKLVDGTWRRLLFQWPVGELHSQWLMP